MITTILQVALFATVVGGSFAAIEIRHYARGYRDTCVARTIARILGK